MRTALIIKQQAFTLALASVLLVRCTEPGAGPRLPDDAISPDVRITFPATAHDYDQDRDGFVDIAVSWSDDSGIVGSSAQIRAIGDSAISTEISGWTVVERTSSGLKIEENLGVLIRGGNHRFEVSVRDSAGNEGSDTVSITLPQSQLWKTIATNRPVNGWGVEMAFCGDGRAYVASGTSIIVVDAARAELITVVSDPYAVENLRTPLCVPGDSVVYVTPGGEQLRLNGTSWRFWPRPGNLYGGIVQSRSDPDLLYAGEHFTGDVAVLSRSGNSRLRRFGLPFSEYEEDRAFSLAVMPNDEKLYSTRALEGGILVSNPRSGALLKRIAPDGNNVHAITNSIKLGTDDKFLYAAVQDANVRGIAEIDTRTDEVSRYLPLTVETDVPTCIAVSPSGRRLFAGTRDRWVGVMSSNYMIDIRKWQVLTRFIRERAQGEARIDGCPAFRPDGKLVFMPRNMDLDIYLNRE